MDIDVEDTPQLQYFKFDRSTSNIQVEILDVYKGDRWDDTCINNIFPYADIIFEQ
jgi:hypothetical protein